MNSVNWNGNLSVNFFYVLDFQIEKQYFFCNDV